jgi:hypothetical protein
VILPVSYNMFYVVSYDILYVNRNL